jgi:hypothetical protein
MVAEYAGKDVRDTRFSVGSEVIVLNLLDCYPRAQTQPHYPRDPRKNFRRLL